MRKALAIVTTLTAAACAAGGGPADADTPAPSQSNIQLVVINERQARIDASVQWLGGRPIRLGELQGGATRTFDVALRGDQFRVIFGAVGSGPGAMEEAGFLSASAGERFEWRLRGDLSVFSQRLPQR